MDSHARGLRISTATFALGLGLAFAANPGVASADESDTGAHAQSSTSGPPSSTGTPGSAARPAASGARSGSPRRPRPGASRSAAASKPSPLSTKGVSGSQSSTPRLPASAVRSSRSAVASTSARPLTERTAPSTVPGPLTAALTTPTPIAEVLQQPAGAAVSPAAASAAQPAGIVSGFLRILGLAPGAGSGVPTTPAEFVTAVLALVRRELQKFFNPGIAAASAQNSQVLPAAAPSTGKTTSITWSWGTNPVIDFNPAADKLDFGWMQASQFTVTEKSGSTVISVVDNNHSYTLRGVSLSQLQMSNIVAKDATTVSKWQNLINAAQPTPPGVSIADASANEGNSGTANLAFTVTMSKASTKVITVGYATSNGTATAGQDYKATSGTVTFAPGVTSQTINVSVVGDTTVEPDETFAVTLSNPSGATLTRPSATGTIVGDDVAPPTVSIANSTANEGNSLSSNMGFTVSLSKASTTPITVRYATSNGTASSGKDYTATSGTITFAAGVTSQAVNVGIIGDTTVESDETFTVTLSSPVGATIASGAAIGTIVNDDTAPQAPSVSIANSTASEGNSGTSTMTFAVTLSKAWTTPVTIGYATSNGTATVGQDYNAVSGTITFAPGVTSQLVNVGVLSDTTVEPDETFTMTLSNPVGATIGRTTATGTILNDDTTAQPGGTSAQWGKSFFAPYIDMCGWPVPDLLQISKATGATLMTLGFIQVNPNGNPAWGGYNVLELNSTNDQAKAMNSSIAAFRAAGGDVAIAFGGAAGTSLAEYYASKGLSAQALADTYRGVVATYGVTRLDFDVESQWTYNKAAIDLNNQALALLQQANPEVQVCYTVSVEPFGLTTDGVYIMDSALKAGVNVSHVNVMAMDYGEWWAPTSGPDAQTMGTYAIRSAQSTYDQMTALYAENGKTFDWSQMGITPMIGVNDITTEVFTVADAQAVENFAREKGIGMLAFWSLQRDNPGTLGQATHDASGLSDAPGSFSNVWNDYGTANIVNYGSTSGGGSANLA